ncbi:25635624-62bf-4f41-8b36-76dfbf465db7 [Thermothielavioides terrestris]|uniref:25635624-62bf-4f41-8b36-76dfbf465db7 n=1 Tax=Thermothielavioides terrestris TaxID=2587410 RepID=A0A446BIX6_9PEZI|nr:25635624-62bf-4f41-8b36-76dfbf465db7 [Thermothielavioides terrestris]
MSTQPSDQGFPSSDVEDNDGDLGSLFGDGDDCGDDAELASLFMEAGALAPCHQPDCDLVVSTQQSTSHPVGSAPVTAPPEESLDDAALEAELQGLWEAISAEDQPVNASAGSQDSHASQDDSHAARDDSHAAQDDSRAAQDDSVILPTQIPGFRYASSQTNRWVRLPRRVDLDQRLATDLMHYITLNRNTKMEDLYSNLELNVGEGKRLCEEMRQLLKEPPLSQLVEHPGNSSMETKRNLVNISFYMLVYRGWGAAWFGSDCRTAKSRTLFWPADSSILLAGFAMLLYRLFRNQRQMHQTVLRTQARILESYAQLAPSPSPTRSPSVQSPPSPCDGASVSADGEAFFDALAREAATSKKRKLAESVLGLAGPPPPYELEVPENARLKYYVYVKDKTDGSDLAPPMKYRHTDCVLMRGAFSRLKSCFEAVEQAPIIEIQTPFGRKSIASEADWDHAVLTIYNVRRAGGVVEVDVFV